MIFGASASSLERMDKTRDRVDGSVTVPSGAFSSSTFDEGFTIQDRTGAASITLNFDPPARLVRRTSPIFAGYGNVSGIVNLHMSLSSTGANSAVAPPKM
jgi:hypothetical protein